MVVRPTYVIGAVLLAMTSVATFAQNERIRQGPIPDWANRSEPIDVPPDVSGPIFVRYNDSLARLTTRGQSLHQSYRIRILHPNALQLGNVTISWNPQAGAAMVHAVRIHRDGTIIDVLRNTEFTVLRREDQLDQARIDGLLTAVLQVPDLRVGDEIEVATTIESNDPTLGASVYGMLFVAPEPPAGRLHLGLSWERGQEPVIRMSPQMAAMAQRTPNSLDLRFDNAGPVAPPNQAPPRFNWQRIAEYSDFADWQSVSRQFEALFRTAATLAPRSPLREEARRIAATNATPLARTQAALRLVQQDVRYIYVGLNAGNLTPATADLTWERRFGDCKGKTALLLALLGELGIPAEAVLANNSDGDDGLNERLPNPGSFDHVLARATIDGITYWLDGTLPAVATPSTEPALSYRWYLPLTQAGADLTARPWQAAPSPDDLTLYDIDARAGFDQPATVTRTTVIRGIGGLLLHAQISALSSSQLLNAIRQQMTGDLWQNIDEVRYRYDARARAAVMTISGTGMVDWDNSSDFATRSLSLPGGGFSPPERRLRPTQQDQSVPYYNAPNFSCYVTTVRIPSATEQIRWTHNSNFNTRLFGRNYARAFDIRENAIRMIRTSRTEQLEISPADAQLDNARIAQFDNSMAWIFFRSAYNRPRRPSPHEVPTVDEIDWTGDETLCSTLLSSD